MAVRMNSNSSAARDSEAAFSWLIIRPPTRTRYGSPRTEKPPIACWRRAHAIADAGLKPADIDGIATAGETPVMVAHYLGLTPKWVDGTAVGGCSFMIHVRHAAAAIAPGPSRRRSRSKTC